MSKLRQQIAMNEGVITKTVFGILQAIVVAVLVAIGKQYGKVNDVLQQLSFESKVQAGRLDKLEEFQASKGARLPGAAPLVSACKAERAEQFAVLMGSGNDAEKAWRLAASVPCDYGS